MRRSPRALSAALGLAVLTACGAQGGAGTMCTAIAGLTGIGVTIDATVAPGVAHAALTVCQEECLDVEMPVCRDDDCGSEGLRPGVESVHTGCSGDDPSDVCGASAVPTGELTGFANLPELTADSVEVTVTLTDRQDARILSETIGVTAEDSYPNGPDCGASGTSAAVSVTDRGVLVES